MKRGSETELNDLPCFSGYPPVYGMTIIVRCYTLLLLFTACLWISACSSMEQPPEEVEQEPSLDETLIEIITIQGQRGLSNFILPESDDLQAIPQDPANPLTPAKVRLGQLLFHETALATNPVKEEAKGTYSCATCHHAGAGFQSGLLQAVGEGGTGWGQNGEGRRKHLSYAAEELDIQPIRTPSVLNGAYQEVMGWAGNFGVRGPNEGTDAFWESGSLEEVNRLGYDGLESQAIAGLTKHRMDRLDDSILRTNSSYVSLWQDAFPGQEVTLEYIGLAIAAYERTLMANEAPFQRWLRGETNAMSAAEKRGAVVFFGKALCEVCHTGPSLNQMDFYALGMPDMPGAQFMGGEIEFLGRGGFVDNSDEEFKFKVPQLYNLTDAPFYGHGGTFRTLREVVEYYNDAIPDVDLPDGRLAVRFEPLDLTQEEIDDLVVFLAESLYDPNLGRYVPSELPSGNCTPANDNQARRDLGCD